jgi:hypothetical protein
MGRAGEKVVEAEDGTGSKGRERKKEHTPEKNCARHVVRPDEIEASANLQNSSRQRACDGFKTQVEMGWKLTLPTVRTHQGTLYFLT